MKATIYFAFERSTKNTHRYIELDRDLRAPADSDVALVGTLYVKKRAFPGTIPSKVLRVEIEGIEKVQ